MRVYVCEVSWQLRWQSSECGVNSREGREKRACGEFPRGPRLGQGKMSGALEVRREVDEKVSKNGVKQKKRRGLWELRRGGACCCLWPDFFFLFFFYFLL